MLDASTPHGVAAGGLKANVWRDRSMYYVPPPLRCSQQQLLLRLIVFKAFSLWLAFVPAQGWLTVTSFVLRTNRHHATRTTTTALSISESETPGSRRRLSAAIPMGSNGENLATVVSRDVPITPGFSIRVWELERLATIVEDYWGNKEQNDINLDPFGLVSWPGSVVAAQELMKHQHIVHGARVLVLGAGCGIEAQAAASLGAASVLATDLHPTTLQLLEFGAKKASDEMEKIITTALFDIASTETLPDCDLMIVADVLYNEKLAAEVIRRCLEARSRLPWPPIVLVTDSQRFVKGFERDLNAKLRSIGQTETSWTARNLPAFTGSGVAIDEDQTYDVEARVLWIGLEDKPP